METKAKFKYDLELLVLLTLLIGVGIQLGLGHLRTLERFRAGDAVFRQAVSTAGEEGERLQEEAMERHRAWLRAAHLRLADSARLHREQYESVDRSLLILVNPWNEVPADYAPELAEVRDITTAISHATCTVAEDIQAKAIITVTISGFTAFRLSQYKPECPIIACTTQSIVACQMNLMFGVVPLIIPHEDTAEMLFDTAVRQAKHAGLVRAGDEVVLTAGVPLGVSGNTNMIRVIEVW